MKNETFDYLAAYDGKSFDNPTQIRSLTGNLTNYRPVLIKGSGQNMLVEFKSDAIISGRGFKATISYKPQGLGTWSFCSTTNLCQIDEGNCGLDESVTGEISGDYECAGGLKCGYDNCPSHLELSYWVNCCYQPKWRTCKDSLDMENGAIFSPYYPNYYEPYQECSWLIEAPENHTITLEFSTLSVCV